MVAEQVISTINVSGCGGAYPPPAGDFPSPAYFVSEG